VANLACVGAAPLAIVNCLNFGNPEHPEVMWQLSEAIDGLAEGANAYSLPIIGGNVSLYNESGGRDIDPTPVLGLLGLVESLVAPPPGWAWSEGDTVFLLGERTHDTTTPHPLAGSAWATNRGRRGGRLGSFDPTRLVATSNFVTALVAEICAGEAGLFECGARRLARRSGRGRRRNGRRDGSRPHGRRRRRTGRGL
jgi:phosphoribosylformylglycinamidine synthase